MSNDEINTLIGEMKACNGIDYIIIDMPTEFNEAALNTLKHSDGVVFITTEDSAGVSKLKEFVKEIIIFPELRLAYDKLLPIVNKTAQTKISRNVQEIFGEKTVIEAIPQINTAGFTSIKSLSSTMGKFMSELMRFIIGR